MDARRIECAVRRRPVAERRSLERLKERIDRILRRDPRGGARPDARLRSLKPACVPGRHEAVSGTVQERSAEECAKAHELLGPPLSDGSLLFWNLAWPPPWDACGSSACGEPEVFSSWAIAPEDTVFIDIETCGLGDEPVFLVGCLERGREAFRALQWLAPDPSREPELLRRVASFVAGRRVWVSFNGRSFDAPRLRARARRHGVRWPEPGLHLDLLLEVRRLRRRLELPDCRLATLEERILARPRSPGDCPGREAPARWWEYTRTGELAAVAPVVLHNLRDLGTLVRLLEGLSTVRTEPGSS